MTGDLALRQAAKQAGVTVYGTIWVLDELIRTGALKDEEGLDYLLKLDNLNGGIVRLPASELTRRIEELKNKIASSGIADHIEEDEHATKIKN